MVFQVLNLVNFNHSLVILLRQNFPMAAFVTINTTDNAFVLKIPCVFFDISFRRVNNSRNFGNGHIRISPHKFHNYILRF